MPQRRTSATLVTWAVVVAVGLAVAAALAFATRESGNQAGAGAPGGSAPDVVLTDFKDGRRFTLAEYRGEPLVLNFWASWCPPCVAEMPDIEKVHQDLKDEVVFVGVNQRDSHDAAARLVKETGVTYRLASDPDGKVFDAFGAAGMPLTVFIDEDGRVQETIAGQLSEDLLRDFIRRHLGVG